MPTLQVLYPTPTDAATFDRRYREEHAPMVAERMPTARFRAWHVAGAPGGGPAPYHLVAHLEFDSAEAMQAALGSPGGRATARHAFEISTGGAPVFLVSDPL
ncbi:EthD family reductase [Roseisolibacter sp. H3M3-2]|uniref:EthD family reductase n=1 Tax=Roseisolibacter sp. H3M3-2 TaxID=3031323 RepID=UPI0023DAEA78|nr:EthD family reductase [Roseisolibacter sp. H3M3-2]MDF1502539.1 EthD family reductase [Roseisolibacter sp. H3M3-2]